METADGEDGDQLFQSSYLCLPVISALALVTWSPNSASLLNDFCHNLYPVEDLFMAGIFKKGEQPVPKLLIIVTRSNSWFGGLPVEVTFIPSTSILIRCSLKKNKH